MDFVLQSGLCWCVVKRFSGAGTAAKLGTISSNGKELSLSGGSFFTAVTGGELVCNLLETFVQAAFFFPL